MGQSYCDVDVPVSLG